MGKIFKDKDRIMRLFRMNGMNYTKKTCANIRAFVETYAEIKQDFDYLPIERIDNELWKEGPKLFRAMIESDKITREKIEGFIGGMKRSGHLEEMIDKALNELKGFGEDGRLYYNILFPLYFDKETKTNAEVEKELNYSHSSFQMKKEQALMLFGAVFWKAFLEHWENSIEEMYRIELESGRDGSLSERRRTGDRRSGLSDRRKGDRRRVNNGIVCPT